MEDRVPWQRFSLIALFVVLITITVVGNVLIIAAVVTTRRLRTVTNCFVLSLAVADWLVGIFVMPIGAAHNYMGSWKLGGVLCEIWVSLDVCLCTASILSLCAISIDRYFAVTQPLNYSRRRRSKKLALFMIFLVWLGSIAITCPPIFWFKDENKDKTKCEYNENKAYVVFSAMGSFFVPLTVMLYVYARISCVIAQRHENLEAMNNGTSQVKWPLNAPKFPKKPGVNQDESDLERGSSESEDVCRISSVMTRLPENRRLRFTDSTSRVSSFKRESKTAQTLSIVVGGFIACWLPFFVVYLVTPYLEKGTIPPLFMSLLIWLGWSNSAINPFIYAFYSPDFRLAFWRLTIRHCSARQMVSKQSSSISRQSVNLRDSAVYTSSQRT